MNKKLLTILTLLLSVCGGAWADNKVYEWTHNKVFKSLTVTASKTDNSSLGTYSGYSISYTANDNKKYTCSSAVKMESKTQLSFTTSKTANITVGIALKSGTTYAASGKATVKLNGNTSESAISKETTGASTEDAVYVTFANIEAGNQVIGRGGAELGVFYIKVEEIETTTDTESPSITTDLNDATPYAASMGSPLSLAITASHYTGFQWYTCDSDGSNAVAINGATSASYNYTATAEDMATSPKYFKCIVTNTNATGATTATSKIATVNITASNDASVSSIVVVAKGTYQATATGTAYSATIGGTTSATVTITPNEGTAIVSCGGTTGAAGAAINVNATAGTQLSFSITAGNGSTIVNYTLDITKANDKVATDNAYYLASNEAVYGGQQIVGDDITMTFSDAANGTFESAAANAYISGYNANYVAATAGNGQSGSGSGISGTWYKFTPTANGTLTVGAIINDGKQLYIYKNDKNTKITEGVTYWANGTATLNSSLKASGKVYGLVTLNISAGNDYFFSVNGSKMGFYGFKFVPWPTSVSGTITASGYNTYSSVYPLDLSSITDGTAYAATSIEGGKVVLTKCTGKVPAGTGFFIAGTANDEFTINTTADATEAPTGNQLVGMPAGGEVAKAGDGEYNYVFGWTDVNNPGFYLVNNSLPTLAPNKAYLNTTTALTVDASRLSIVFEDETTGIGDATLLVNNEIIKNGEVYNLSGQRVAQPTTGVYIVNGKKVIIK